MRPETPQRRCHAGISLVEMLVALAISAVIATALASLFGQSVTSRQQVDRDGLRLDSGRYAMDVIADDLRMAGFYGDYKPAVGGDYWPATGFTWTAPTPCVATPVTVAALGWSNTAGSENVPVGIFGYAAPASATLPCLDQLKAGTDVIVVRRLSTSANALGAGTLVTNNMYLQASNCSFEATRFSIAPYASGTAAADFPRMGLACSASQVSRLRRYITRIYYVATCNETCGTANDDGIPTLKVVELDVDPSDSVLKMLEPQVLVPGVDHLHVEYGIDSSGDGNVDAYQQSSSAPTISAPFAWQNVMSVKVHAILRDLDPTTGFADNRTYTLGSRAVTFTAASEKPFKRSVFSSVYRLVNPAGAREKPL